MITIAANVLADALASAVKGSDLVLIRAGDGNLAATTTNLSIWVDEARPCEGDLQPICVSAERLRSATKSAGKDELKLEAKPTGLAIRWLGGKAMLPITPADGFPVPLEIGGAATITVDGAELARGIRLVETAIVEDQLKTWTHGAYLEGDGTIVATDGQRIHATRLQARVDGDFTGALIPLATLNILRGVKGEIVLRIDERALEASYAGGRVWSKLIDSAFPAYRGVIPEAASPVASFVAADLSFALSRVSWGWEKERRTGLRFVPGEDGKVWINESQAETTFGCEAFEAHELGLNGRWLDDLLKNIGPKGVTLHKSGMPFYWFVVDDCDDLHVMVKMLMEPYKEIVDE